MRRVLPGRERRRGKLREVRRRIDESGRDIRLEIDGGVKVDNIREIVITSYSIHYTKLYEQPLENAPPMLAFTTVALGGFRGLISNALWMRANELQQEGRRLLLTLGQLASEPALPVQPVQTAQPARVAVSRPAAASPVAQPVSESAAGLINRIKSLDFRRGKDGLV